MKKRIVALMMSCLLVVTSAFGAFADNEAGSNFDSDMIYYNTEVTKIAREYHFEEFARNDRFILHCDQESAIVCIEDMTTKQLWFSSPPIDPKTLGGEAISSVRSMLKVYYTNPAMVQKDIYNAMEQEVNTTITKLSNGIRFDFDFHKPKFSIPVSFVLTDNGVEASIHVSEIKEYGENVINSIDFLKYFGATQVGTDGYLVIPDGSGAIAEFDNGKNMTMLEYNKPFYGDDAAELTTRAVQTSREETITLPVGGLVRGEMEYVDDGILTPLYNANVALDEAIEAADKALGDADKAVKEAEKAVKDRDDKKEELDELKAAEEPVAKDIEEAQKAYDEAVAAAKPLINEAVAQTKAVEQPIQNVKKAYLASQKEAQAVEGEESERAIASAKEMAKDSEKTRAEFVDLVDRVAAFADKIELSADIAEPIKYQKPQPEPVTDAPEAEAETTDAPEVEADDDARYGFLFEVTSGAENASLKANVSGNKLNGDFNCIYTNMVYRVSYKVPLKGQSSQNDVLFNAEDPISTDMYTLNYRFSDSDNTSYTSLANDYRDVLTKRGWLTEDGVTERFYLEFYGAVNKKKSMAGFVYTARETLTSFNEAKSILQELQESGQVNNIQVLYNNVTDDYFEGDMEIALDPSDSLGGLEDLKSLIQYAKSINTDIAVAADFMSFHSGGNGVSTFWDVADVINVSPIKVYPFALNSNTMDTTDSPYYLLAPSKYNETVSTLLDSVRENGYTSLYFDAEAVQLYSDLAPGGYQAERTSKAQAEQFGKLAAANLQLTMSNPNAYLFQYADYIVDVPVCSSKEILFDQDVPFLQTVLRGMKNFSGESMNINDVSDESFLRHMEYGTDMKYSLINAETEVLLKTDMTFLYSATYKTFKDQIIDRYASFMEFGAAVGDAGIIAHERMNNGDVAVTTYGDIADDGTETKVATVYVNYGDEAVTIGDVTVEAMDYTIVV